MQPPYRSGGGWYPPEDTGSGYSPLPSSARSPPYSAGSGGSPHTLHQQQRDSEDPLYTGFEQMASTSAIHQTVGGPAAGAATLGGSSAGGSAGGAGNAHLGTAAMRPPTSMIGAPVESARPMTSLQGAGYSSHGASSRSAAFDPLNQGGLLGTAPPLEQPTRDDPQHTATRMTARVHELIEQSAAESARGEFRAALNLAKQAAKHERALRQHLDAHQLADLVNPDLKYSVFFNLGFQFQRCGMMQQALETYSLVVQNKTYQDAARLRVNMGNIYFGQGNYQQAMKMYRMAMDQIGQTSRAVRFKIMRNVGVALIRMRQYPDAINAFEEIMDAEPDIQSGFNLLVCYYASGNRDKMKKGFLQLLAAYPSELVPARTQPDEDKEIAAAFGSRPGNNRMTTTIAAAMASASASASTAAAAAAPMPASARRDALRDELAQRRKQAEKLVLNAAKLVAPAIERSIASGYDWVIEQLKATPPSAAAEEQDTADSVQPRFPRLAMEMEIAKGVAFLKKRGIREAIEVFSGFEQKDSALLDQAATNLSFLYFLEGDIRNASKYADIAVRADRYNARALVNKANLDFIHGEYESAKELYLEAIGVEADCVEAIFNLGLVNKQIGHVEEALQAFRKLHRIIPKDPQVIYHIANLYELVEDDEQAAEWFKILQGIVPTDPKVLSRLGSLYNKQGDDNQAYHNFLESYQCYPVNMDVVSWLGVWYVKRDLYERALQFFERAAEIDPNEVQWRLLVAKCYRRMGALQEALDMYKDIHREDPDSIECLHHLKALSKELHDPEYENYARLLARLERERGSGSAARRGRDGFEGDVERQQQRQQAERQTRSHAMPYQVASALQREQQPQQQQHQQDREPEDLPYAVPTVQRDDRGYDDQQDGLDLDDDQNGQQQPPPYADQQYQQPLPDVDMGVAPRNIERLEARDDDLFGDDDLDDILPD